MTCQEVQVGIDPMPYDSPGRPSLGPDEGPL